MIRPGHHSGFPAVGIDGRTGVPITSDETKMTIPEMMDDKVKDAARAYMLACGIRPTPDAIAQLTNVFLPCLRIMCERPWDPEGATWRRSGRFGILSDVRKKFERLWERGWHHGKMHDDSGFDLINYVGFFLRSGDSLWNEWGDPYTKEGDSGRDL